MHLSPELLRLQFRLCAVWQLREETASVQIITPRISSLGKDSLHLISIGRILFSASFGTKIKKIKGTNQKSTLYFSLDFMLIVHTQNSFQTWLFVGPEFWQGMSKWWWDLQKRAAGEHKRDQGQGGPQPNSCLASGADKPQAPLGILKRQAKGRGMFGPVCAVLIHWGPSGGQAWCGGSLCLPAETDSPPASSALPTGTAIVSLMELTMRLMTSGPSWDTSIRELEMGVELNYRIEREERE